MPTTWNPADKTGNTTLSNGNLTSAFSTTNDGVRSVYSDSAGKWYWEATFTTGSGAGVGFANASAVGGVSQHCGSRHLGDDLFKEFQPFSGKRIFKEHKAGGVTTGPSQIIDKAASHWIGNAHENNRQHAVEMLQGRNAWGSAR